MDIYYFATEEERPEGPEEWTFWNMVIPLKDRRPKQGDDILIINYETGQEAIAKVTMGDDVQKWPFKLPDKFRYYVLETIFKKM